VLDRLDREIVHALHLDGRAPFRHLADVLGVSPQTVARRYRALRSSAGLRVVGLPQPDRVGLARWMVRLTAAPATAGELARALARRPDTSWVRLTSGGTEIVAIVTAPAGSPSLLLHDIPRTSSVTAVSAHYVLHVYLGGPSTWAGRVDALSPEQQERIRPEHAAGERPEPAGLTPADHGLLDVLSRDGRAGYAELAVATGSSQATVARRIAELRAAGAVYFDVEIDDAQLGVSTRAMLWMAVAPSWLDRVATAMAGHAELAFVAATTGPSNLIAQALCHSPEDLHRYLTRRLGALDGITAIETAPVLQTVKAAGAVPFAPARRR
jgi:DNA-binding Lrp family transcriptional regulator